MGQSTRSGTAARHASEPGAGCISDNNHCDQTPGTFSADGDYSYPAIQGNIRMPGMGESGKGCGEDVIMLCPCCGRKEKIISHCDQRDCPVCYRRWASDEAMIMRARVFDMGRRIHHMVVSWDEDMLKNVGEYDDETIRQRRRDVYKILKQSGAAGGVVVFHPFREGKRGEYTRFAPHYHAFMDAAWVDIDYTALRKRGIFAKRIGRVDRSFDRFYYLLDHCGYTRSIESVTWFGSMARNRGQGPEETELRGSGGLKRVCPDCGAELEIEFLYDWDSMNMIKYVVWDGG